jgi:hypothetical protein
VLALAHLLPALARLREERRRIRSLNNLNQIAKALAVYLNQYGSERHYPPHLGILVDTGLLPARTLVRPGDRRPQKLPNGLLCSYEYNPNIGAQSAEDFPPNEPLIWERKAFSSRGRCILFADSHVELWSPSELSSELLKKSNATAAKQ